MQQIKVVPLGAGQDVGRSCVLVSIGGKNIIFDCGMHMGYNDARRFPDFSYLSKKGNFDEIVDCVIITHFHLDHCGSLPYFTEMCGFNGPIYMTYPTKAICPILLEDYRKITVDRKGEKNFFSTQDIKNCMKKVIAINVHERVWVDDELEITPYYAGHVLGAAMFYARVGQQSVVYTGDYNMTPDSHLGSAWIDNLKPDLLITETTYATTIRDSKRQRERDFLKRIHKCVERGGKVLIPVFALGRAQELCILLEMYWERMNLSVPIYFSMGLTEKANHYYRLFINWTNEKIKQTFAKRNLFDFRHIQPFDRSMSSAPGPMVLFATPGMLHAGLSLQIFKLWAGDERNMVIIPGYCVVGTVGNKLLAGKGTSRKVEIDKNTTIDVKCDVKNLSFSAHADAKGIMQLIRWCEPKHVMLVHGERGKMQFLKKQIGIEFGLRCYSPPNGTVVTIDTSQSIPIRIAKNLFKRPLAPASEETNDSSMVDVLTDTEAMRKRRKEENERSIEGILVMDGMSGGDEQMLKLMDDQTAVRHMGTVMHTLAFELDLKLKEGISCKDLLDDIAGHLFRLIPTERVNRTSDSVSLRSLCFKESESSNSVAVSWTFEEEELAEALMKAISGLLA